MLPTVRFGDTFKVTSPTRSFADLEATHRQELQAKLEAAQAKGDDWNIRSAQRDVDGFDTYGADYRMDALQRKVDFEALGPAYAAQEKAGFTLVHEPLAPAVPKAGAGEAQSKTAYLVSDGPDGQDATLYETVLKLSQLKSAAVSEGADVPADFSARYDALLDKLHERLGQAIELPKIEHDARR